MSMIDSLKLMVDPAAAADESMLSAFLDLAGQKIIARAYPFQRNITEVPSCYEYLQVEIAAYMINKRGADYQVSHAENGITRVYESADVPASMLRAIVPYCGVISSADDGN